MYSVGFLSWALLWIMSWLMGTALAMWDFVLLPPHFKVLFFTASIKVPLISTPWLCLSSLSFNHFGFLFVFLPVQWWHTREWQLSLLWRFQRNSLPHLFKPKQARRELWWRLVILIERLEEDVGQGCSTDLCILDSLLARPASQKKWQKCHNGCPFKQQWRKHGGRGLTLVGN